MEWVLICWMWALCLTLTTLTFTDMFLIVYETEVSIKNGDDLNEEI